MQTKLRQKGILTNQSNKLIMQSLKSFSSILIDDERTSNDVDNRLIDNLYDELLKACTSSMNVHYDVENTQIDNGNTMKLFPSYFLDHRIVKNIKATLDYRTVVRFKIKNCSFLIELYYKYNEIKLVHERILHIIKALIFCLNQVSVGKNDRFDYKIQIYFDDTKKGFENGFSNTIEPYHLNSGFYFHDPTTNISNIIIFRKEEWFKVLLHECIHCFNIDFKSIRLNFSQMFSDTFYIPSDMVLNEAFTEFWARILNVGFYSVTHIQSYNLNSPKKQKIDFRKVFDATIQIERCFSIYQSQKMLSFFGLTYSDIVDKEKSKFVSKLYKEKTNAFCYYVISSIMLSDLSKTLKWLWSEEQKVFSINKTERQILIYCYHLKNIATGDKYMSLIKDISKLKMKVNTGMRHCAVDIVL
jgi:hypothetical protein